jgi:hypothetical protein
VDEKFYTTSATQNERIGWVNFVREGFNVVLILDSHTTNQF